MSDQFKSMPARFKGRCPVCRTAIEIGDRIVYRYSDDHAACGVCADNYRYADKEPDPTVLAARETICRECYLTHPRGQECP